MSVVDFFTVFSKLVMIVISNLGGGGVPDGCTGLFVSLKITLT